MRNGRRTLFTILFLILDVGLLIGGVLCLRIGDHPILPLLAMLQVTAAILFLGIWVQVMRTERGIQRHLGSPVDLLFSDGAKQIQNYLEGIKRKEALLMPQVVEGRIGSREELARVLERLVSVAYRSCQAESAELALFDRDNAQYHSSIVVGRPFRESIDEVIPEIGKAKQNEVEPIIFAGTILGALRIALPHGRSLNEEQRAILRFLALQTSVALVNTDFVSELIRMRQLAEDSVKAKTGFLANLSHELRGPLGIILNAVELVLENLCGPVTDDQRETLGMVRSNGAHLLDLINDVLDYAKVESGKMNPQPCDMSAEDLIADIASVVRSQADAKHHTLKTKISDSLFVRCDRRHMRQILINMLTNAIKYTPDGGTITLGAERVVGGKIKLFVSDTGIGIPESDRDKVFNAFERVDHAYAQKQVGTGLGMPLTKKLAEINGGTFDFTSQPGVGSTFWVVLNSGSSVTDDIAHDTMREKILGNGATVLYVANQDMERSMNERYLIEHDFKVHVASNPHEVARALSAQTPDIVIIDENCHEAFDGEPTQQIRDMLQTTAVPVALLSSKAFVFDVERNLRSGADRHVAKPISLYELGSLCVELIEKESRVNKKGKASPLSDKTSTLH